MNIITGIFGLILGIVSSLVAAGILYWLDISADEFFIKVRGRIPAGFLIFITGTNGAGKTTTAVEVAKRLGMRYVEVNTLRESLRSQRQLYIDAGQEANYNILHLSSLPK